MAVVYDLRTWNQPGFAARHSFAGGLLHVHFGLSTAQLAALSVKAPDRFLVDLLARSTTLLGPYWIIAAAPSPHPSPSHDWQMHCELGDLKDFVLLKAGPTFQWNDALTGFTMPRPPRAAGLLLRMDVMAPAPGLAGTHRESADVLV
jgi:hypothetical protein